MTEQNKYWCYRCNREHCQHKKCGNNGVTFKDLHCINCRADLHYNTIREDAKQSFGDKFEPTGLTYFTTPLTYQYLHLNSRIRFRSKETNPEKAGAYWLAQLDNLDEKRKTDLNTFGTFVSYRK
jgi:hypothetical protein